MPTAFQNTSTVASVEIGDEELAEIGMILDMWCNFNMSVYKDSCMKRRVAIRMQTIQCRNAAEYCCLLRQNEPERELLRKTLTIHVSHFFRDPSMYERLRWDILPDLFETAAQTGEPPLRIWSLGCATGEEPYSLAILLREHFAPQLEQRGVAIVGTDIDADTLESARYGAYNGDRLKEVAPEMKGRWFHPDGPRFRLIPEIRSMVEFQPGDIAGGCRYLPSTLVLCRNTLIYFTRPDQEKILDGITHILPQGGILVLGRSESLMGASRRCFEPVCHAERIFRKVAPII